MSDRELHPENFNGLQFYHQRTNGEGRRASFFLLESMSHFHHRLPLQAGPGSFLVPTWSGYDSHGTVEKLFQVLV